MTAIEALEILKNDIEAWQAGEMDSLSDSDLRQGMLSTIEKGLHNEGGEE